MGFAPDPIQGQLCPVNSLQGLAGLKTALPHQENVGCCPLWDTMMDRTTGAKAHLLRCNPLAVGAERGGEDSRRLAILDAGATAPQWMRLVGWRPLLEAHSQCVRECAKGGRLSWGTRPPQGCCRRGCFSIASHHRSLLS